MNKFRPLRKKNADPNGTSSSKFRAGFSHIVKFLFNRKNGISGGLHKADDYLLNIQSTNNSTSNGEIFQDSSPDHTDLNHAASITICELRNPEINCRKPYIKELQQIFSKAILNPENFTFIRTIGTGTIGRVFLTLLDPKQDIALVPDVHNSLNDSKAEAQICKEVYSIPYALKRMSKKKILEFRQERHIVEERRILEILDHPLIVSMYASFQTDTHLYILMEYVKGGELFSLLRRGPLVADAVRFYSAEVLLAIDYLHAHGILYRDLKPENILVAETGHLKLVDFGFAKFIGKGDIFNYASNTLPKKECASNIYNEAAKSNSAFKTNGQLSSSIESIIWERNTVDEIETTKESYRQEANYCNSTVHPLISEAIKLDESDSNSRQSDKMDSFLKGVKGVEAYNNQTWAEMSTRSTLRGCTDRSENCFEYPQHPYPTECKNVFPDPLEHNAELSIRLIPRYASLEDPQLESTRQNNAETPSIIDSTGDDTCKVYHASLIVAETTNTALFDVASFSSSVDVGRSDSLEGEAQFRFLSPSHQSSLKSATHEACDIANERNGFSNQGTIDCTRTFTLCGTNEYMAPETILRTGQTFATDAWALGVLIYELLFGYTPFVSYDPKQLYENILNQSVSFPSNEDSDANELILQLLTKPTEYRMTLRKAKTHRFFKGLINAESESYGQIQAPPYLPHLSGAFDSSAFDIYAESAEMPITEEDMANIDSQNHWFLGF